MPHYDPVYAGGDSGQVQLPCRILMVLTAGARVKDFRPLRGGTGMRADTRDLACVRAQKMESRPPRRARGPPTLQANGSAAAARWLVASAGKRPAPFEGIAGRRPAPAQQEITYVGFHY